MIARSFTKVLMGVTAVASLALAGPAFAQRQGEKAPAQPFKLDKVVPEHQINYVIDADPAHDPDNVLVLDLSNGGRVLIRLVPEWAPHHVERFYNGVIFHRVIDGFMAQTGDPTGTGQGGSKLPDLQAEFNDAPHMRGTVSMARTNEPNSANSQFFIVFYPRFALDHKYTNFGRVISGMDMVDTIVRGEPPQNPTKIVQASILSDNKPRPTLAAPAPSGAITADMLSKSRSN